MSHFDPITAEDFTGQADVPPSPNDLESLRARAAQFAAVVEVEPIGHGMVNVRVLAPYGHVWAVEGGGHELAVDADIVGGPEGMPEAIGELLAVMEDGIRRCTERGCPVCRAEFERLNKRERV